MPAKQRGSSLITDTAVYGCGQRAAPLDTPRDLGIAGRGRREPLALSTHPRSSPETRCPGERATQRQDVLRWRRLPVLASAASDLPCQPSPAPPSLRPCAAAVGTPTRFVGSLPRSGAETQPAGQSGCARTAAERVRESLRPRRETIYRRRARGRTRQSSGHGRRGHLSKAADTPCWTSEGEAGPSLLACLVEVPLKPEPVEGAAARGGEGLAASGPATAAAVPALPHRMGSAAHAATRLCALFSGAPVVMAWKRGFHRGGAGSGPEGTAPACQTPLRGGRGTVCDHMTVCVLVCVSARVRACVVVACDRDRLCVTI